MLLEQAKREFEEMNWSYFDWWDSMTDIDLTDTANQERYAVFQRQMSDSLSRRRALLVPCGMWAGINATVNRGIITK